MLRILFLLLPFLWSVLLMAQPKQQACTTCFTTEVVRAENVSENCRAYEWRVSFSGACAHALSHFSVEVPCGEVTGLWNSEGWKQEIGLDPTSGLNGFKIDDIPEFGKRSLTSFTVKFTLCGEDSACRSRLSCWAPRIAYKAATCVHYDTLQIQCSPLVASIVKDDVSCYGAGDGAMRVVVDGGVAPVNFSWSTGATDAALHDLVPGLYSVVVRDASGAEIVLSESIIEPARLKVEGEITHGPCGPDAGGAIALTVSGGSKGYAFMWSDGVDTKDRSGLSAGEYAVVVSDSTGCSAEASFQITPESDIALTGSVTAPACALSNGGIDLVVSGGAAPYTYAWSTGAVTEDIAGIAEGVYQVRVTDARGCTAEAHFVVHGVNPLTITSVMTPTDCNENTGAVDITVGGGAAPLSFTWSNGFNTEDLTGASASDYTVTVTDANNCSVSRTFSIGEKTFDVDAAVTKPTCAGGRDGSIMLQEPADGEGPFTYAWSNGESENTIDGLGAGMYTVTVTDAAGCSKELSFYVANPSRISASHSVSNTACGTEGHFSIDLTASGGAGGYDITWPDGATGESRENMPSGSYVVTINDSLGCAIDYEFEVAANTNNLSCAIGPLTVTPVCGSSGNTLTSIADDADSYLWSLESGDAGWSIEGDTTSRVITFAAGSGGSTATFTLTVSRDGCVSQCTYTVQACVDSGEDTDEPGDGDTGGTDGDGSGDDDDTGGTDDGNGTEDCATCFESVAKSLHNDGTCATYEVVVSTTGGCKHELSHWTIEIPCGNISDASVSEGWTIESGLDPTTGLSGLKVDEISGFGKSPDAFRVQFTVCYDARCPDRWAPVVAYKAGRCVSYDTLSIQVSGSQGSLEVNAYPNPFREELTFEWTSRTDTYGILEIFDQFGHRVGVIYEGAIESGIRYERAFPGTELIAGIYYYKFTSGSKSVRGKLFRQ